MTVDLETLELLTAVTVGGKSCAFESISDVGQVSDPSKVNRNGVEGHEESREQKEWYGHDRCQEDTVLYIHSCSNNQSNTLCDE